MSAKSKPYVVLKEDLDSVTYRWKSTKQVFTIYRDEYNNWTQATLTSGEPITLPEGFLTIYAVAEMLGLPAFC